MVSYLREKKPERKAQIVYLPLGLIKKLKRFAVDHDLAAELGGLGRVVDDAELRLGAVGGLDEAVGRVRAKLVLRQGSRFPTWTSRSTNWE